MSMVSKLVESIKRIHLNYNMITSLYMMEPMERTIINCILLLALSLVMYSSWVYLPHYTVKLFKLLSGILPNWTNLISFRIWGGETPIEDDGSDTIYRYTEEL